MGISGGNLILSDSTQMGAPSTPFSPGWISGNSDHMLEIWQARLAPSFPAGGPSSSSCTAPPSPLPPNPNPAPPPRPAPPQSGMMSTKSIDGMQFAELNANRQFGLMYQDIPTLPGRKMFWSFSHRGARRDARPALLQRGPAPPLPPPHPRSCRRRAPPQGATASTR